MKSFIRSLCVFAAGVVAAGAWAQHANSPGVVQRSSERTELHVQVLRPVPTVVPRMVEPTTERSLGQWLARMHDASRQRSYSGTFVVSSAGGAMSSSRIWHTAVADQQVERVDALTGPPRSTFRQDDQVVTFFPLSRKVQMERRDALRMFPDLLKTQDAALAESYTSRRLGLDRVAGLEADVVQIDPRDSSRYGYRIWSERSTGLVLKLQTLDSQGRALEQSAFSELQLDARVSMDQLLSMMRNTQGYRVENLETTPTSAAAEGWTFKSRVAGFKLISSVRRPDQAMWEDGTPPSGRGPTPPTVQWTFSDGLASVSLFVEPMGAQTGRQEVSLSLGATGLVSRRIQDWWLTVVGEVPKPTLDAFVNSLERSR